MYLGGESMFLQRDAEETGFEEWVHAGDEGVAWGGTGEGGR